MPRLEKDKVQILFNEASGEYDIDAHKISIEELCERNGTDPLNGLTEAKVRENRSTYGYNTLSPLSSSSGCIKFLKNFFNPFATLVWVQALFYFLSFIFIAFIFGTTSLDKVLLAIVSLAVVIVNGCISYIQDVKTARVLKSLKKMASQYSFCVRDGKTVEIRSEEVTVGDIVVLKSGDFIPGDIRVIEATNFKVDNSHVTGESGPQERFPELTHPNPFQTKNLIFFSTYVIEGTAKGIVVNTGNHTFVGQLVKYTGKFKSRKSTFTYEIRHFISRLSKAGRRISIIAFIFAFITGSHWLNGFILTIAVFMVNIPEGLLISTTTSLIQAAKRISLKNGVVKNLETVETLGSTSVICVDKARTLDQNKIIVAHACLHDEITEIDLSLEKSPNSSLEGWKFLERSAALCNTAEFLPDQESVPILGRKFNGSAIEGALLMFAAQTIGNVNQVRSEKAKICEVTTSSKYQLSIHKTNDFSDKGALLVMKGEPEEILQRCTTTLIDGEESLLFPELRSRVMQSYFELLRRGEYVLGFCDFNLPLDSYPSEYPFNVEDINFPTEGLRFLGMISMVNPPRATVPNAIAKCRSAGIRIIMMTGDAEVAAEVFARNVGIISGDTENDSTGVAAVVLGDQLTQMPEKEIESLIQQYPELVFARINPQQKVAIVQACQRIGWIVAATGDGVNDAPVLRTSNIGIALGTSGSDIAKEAADMILLDDDFSSIVSGIEEGRLAFDNLKKTFAYSLSSNIPQLAPFIVFILCDIPMPLSVIAILILDLGIDMIPSIFLSNESAEHDLMKLSPRNPYTQKLTSSNMFRLAYHHIGLIEAGAALFAYFTIMASNGFFPSILLGSRRLWESKDINDLMDSYGQEWTYLQRNNLLQTSQTGYFTSIAVTQCVNLILSKTRRNSIFTQGMKQNKLLNFGCFFQILLVLLLVYIPGMDISFGMHPLRISFWLVPLLFAFFLFIHEESRKYFIRNYGKENWVKTEFGY
uniref:Sodium/potassium-transporting ATPase subunit alpha n=1 Tax=Lepeophtheirus salmonis TaxID=72036 RepID=A0A0K2UVM5_LEPSM